MAKKILITGASGFIGQHVTKLLKEHYQVIGLSKNDLDLTNVKKVQGYFKKHHFDIIVHLAANVPGSDVIVEQRKAFNENITSVQNILEAFSQSKAQKFIYTSGISVVAQRDSLYVLSKYLGEIISQYYQEQFKKQVIILRISAPYGPGQHPNNVIPIFIKAAISNKDIRVFGSGKRSQDFVYVDDVARAFLAATRSNKSAIYNVGSGESTSTKRLAQTILKAIPKSRSKIVFSGKDPQENYRLDLDISKTKRELKFAPKVKLEEGIKRIL